MFRGPMQLAYSAYREDRLWVQEVLEAVQFKDSLLVDVATEHC